MATVRDLIGLSIRENRIVTEYPDTAAECDTLETGLRCVCEASADTSGDGYSGPESRGMTEFWGTDDGSEWRVHVVRPT